MKNDSIENIISQYFTLTGRPVSTMTVPEYLEFLDYKKVTEIQPVITPKNPAHDSGQNTDIKEFSHNQKDIEPIKSSKEITTTQKSNALAMLQSVKG